MAKYVESGNLMRAFRRNANEEVNLRHTLACINRQRNIMLQLWETDVRMLKAALKSVRTCSGYSSEGLPGECSSIDDYYGVQRPMLYLYNRKVFNAKQAMDTNKRKKISSEVRAESREKLRNELRINSIQLGVDDLTKLRSRMVIMVRRKVDEMSSDPTMEIVPKFEDINNADKLDAVEVEKKLKNKSIQLLRMNEHNKKKAALNIRISMFHRKSAAERLLLGRQTMQRKGIIPRANTR